MNATWGRQVILAGSIVVAAGASAQEPEVPGGNWRSGAAATYTNPALTGAGLYLDLTVAADGSFRGSWGQYYCIAYPGANGIAIHSCSMNPTTLKPATGRFAPGGRGVIDLQQLGRSAFTWTAATADELAIELPRNWRGDDAILYRAHLTRNGRPKPQAAPAPREGDALLSAVALYREFQRDAQAALARHGGKSLVLEGLRGTLITLSDGGAAIHIPDGFQPRALVLVFRDRREVSRIAEGARFRFRCTVTDFAYQYVQMDHCSVVR